MRNGKKWARILRREERHTMGKKQKWFDEDCRVFAAKEIRLIGNAIRRF